MAEVGGSDTDGLGNGESNPACRVGAVPRWSAWSDLYGGMARAEGLGAWGCGSPDVEENVVRATGQRWRGPRRCGRGPRGTRVAESQTRRDAGGAGSVASLPAGIQYRTEGHNAGSASGARRVMKRPTIWMAWKRAANTDLAARKCAPVVSTSSTIAMNAGQERSGSRRFGTRPRSAMEQVAPDCRARRRCFPAG